MSLTKLIKRKHNKAALTDKSIHGKFHIFYSGLSVGFSLWPKTIGSVMDL